MQDFIDDCQIIPVEGTAEVLAVAFEQQRVEKERRAAEEAAERARIAEEQQAVRLQELAELAKETARLDAIEARVRAEREEKESKERQEELERQKMEAARLEADNLARIKFAADAEQRRIDAEQKQAATAVVAPKADGGQK